MKLRALKVLILSIAISALMSISAFAANDGGGVVTANGVNLRASAGTGSSIIASANKDTPLVIMNRQSDDWYKVWVNGHEGYMSANYISCSDSVDANFGKGTVQGTTVRLRAAADTSSNILGHYNTGAQLDVTGVNGNWYKVDANGTTGYIHSDYLALANQQLSSAPASGSSIVNTAYKYMGVPYVWAGTSPKGFDCSGFIYYVFGEHGIKTNRTAASLYNNGSYVQRSDLQPGDIICFYNGGYSYIGHVGIYIGNDQFIHASSAGGKVVIDSLSSKYYNSHYYGARRISS